MPQYSEWGIGTLDELGSAIRGLAGVSSDKKDFGWPNDHKYTWKYWSGTAWTPGANDIKVQCKAKAKGNMYSFLKICNFLMIFEEKTVLIRNIGRFFIFKKQS